MKFYRTSSVVLLYFVIVIIAEGSIIIIEDAKACFRRTMAGKRVVRGLVRKLLICDTVEQCQQECGDERRFTCEGFNYRLDPTGRGKGECELIDLPLTKIDIDRETVRDPDYDFYVRDRNAAQVNCRQLPSDNSYGGGYDYGEGGNRRGDDTRTPYDRRPIETARPLRRPTQDRWDGDYGDRRPPPPYLPEDNRRPDYGNRRGDYSFHHSHESHSSNSYHYNEHSLDRISDHHQQTRPIPGIHYLPASYEDRFIPLPPKKYPVIIPLDDPRYPKDPLPSRYPGDYEKWGSYGDKYRYGLNHHRNNYYIPPKPLKPEIPDDWGRYGGNYGNGVSLEYQGYHNKQTYNYWGFNKLDEERRPFHYGSDLLPPRRYLPTEKPHIAESYLPLPRPNNNGWSGGYDLDNNIFPLEPRKPDFVKDECSLRSATGFRLHKGIVKKFLFVPNIYECELLCVKEKDFPCASYAFKYTINPIVYNCYLSNRNYKELDYYTDVEPDRDFDIYTMNNRNRCQEPVLFSGRQNSDCFWRVRSGQRLDHSVVRDSLSVKNIVDCQLECLNSRRFTCRAYSFRYGIPVVGGAIDNCQLTDWPFYELDPKIHFVPEPDFEVYERGSYGHGCEPDHFGIRGKIPPVRDSDKVDQLCYIGFGSAAKLLPRATIKSIYVPTELDCKEECSKARESVAFRCMSFSFVTDGPKIGHNCYLSDIMQRDLLPNVDYVHDPNSWLFTWDNYNPKCIELAYKPSSANNFVGHSDSVLRENSYVEKYGLDYINPLDVWRVYSVSGWPCKRGTLCKENREAGFWYCELESGDKDAWDYCCSPDHHCGFSNGYPYSWCYVGPTKTQWRKCNDQYYPYNHNTLDRFDSVSRPWHTSGHFPPRPQTPGYRPDRPNAHPKPVPSKPTLDQYEEEFDNEFLSPPKPGGFGPPRRWPVAYLHKELPPNATTRMEKSSEDTKLSAIKSLIDVIKNTEIQNVQYHISNDSKHKADDVLYVKIPLPNFDDGFKNDTTQKALNELSSNTSVNFENVERSRVQKSLPLRQALPEFTTQKLFSSKISPVRKGFVTRTNITSIRNFRSL
ncbi:unnamed protein product [Ceutorhynchus assimilis]|uniref:Apple domain-containing protein n=1 Tax=Ceutorhynchus assimilis TaxID=467358 RepID=A0A9N9QP89_9CUCU|nr:unnamed protein product [Ceutorhynchus assimilis]